MKAVGALIDPAYQAFVIFVPGSSCLGLCGNDAPDLTLENYFVLAAMVDAGYQF
jgi:hypothetical protein